MEVEKKTVKDIIKEEVQKQGEFNAEAAKNIKERIYAIMANMLYLDIIKKTIVVEDNKQ